MALRSYMRPCNLQAVGWNPLHGAVREAKNVGHSGKLSLRFQRLQDHTESFLFPCIVTILSSLFFHRDSSLYRGFLSSEELTLFHVVQFCHRQIVSFLISMEIPLFYLHLKMFSLLSINSFLECNSHTAYLL